MSKTARQPRWQKFNVRFLSNGKPKAVGLHARQTKAEILVMVADMLNRGGVWFIAGEIKDIRVEIVR